MAGQINRGSTMGEYIYNIALRPENNVFLEIGTWNGQGSTKCFIDALKNKNHNDWKFYSLECCKEFFESASKFYENNINENIKLLHGTILEDPESSIKEYGFDISSLKKNDIYKTEYEEFLENDLINYKNCPYVLDCIPDKIDVVLLDGGEFTTYAEYQILKYRTKIFILDDSNILKNTRVREELSTHNDWQLVVHKNIRNGFSIFQKHNSN